MSISHHVELPVCFWDVGIESWALMAVGVGFVFSPYGFLAG